MAAQSCRGLFTKKKGKKSETLSKKAACWKGLDYPGGVSSLGLVLWVPPPVKTLQLTLLLTIAQPDSQRNAHCYYSSQHDDLKPWISSPFPSQYSIWHSPEISFLLYQTGCDLILIRFLFQTYQLPDNREIKRGWEHVNYLICTRAKVCNSESQIWYLNFKCPLLGGRGECESL